MITVSTLISMGETRSAYSGKGKVIVQNRLGHRKEIAGSIEKNVHRHRAQRRSKKSAYQFFCHAGFKERRRTPVKLINTAYLADARAAHKATPSPVNKMLFVQITIRQNAARLNQWRMTNIQDDALRPKNRPANFFGHIAVRQRPAERASLDPDTQLTSATAALKF